MAVSIMIYTKSKLTDKIPAMHTNSIENQGPLIWQYKLRTTMAKENISSIIFCLETKKHTKSNIQFSLMCLSSFLNVLIMIKSYFSSCVFPIIFSPLVSTMVANMIVKYCQNMLKIIKIYSFIKSF